MAGRCGILRLAGLALIGTAAFATTLEAAIAPYYERVRRFSLAMSMAPTAAAMLSAHGLIERIEHLDDGTIIFRAGPCYVPATLEEVPQGGAAAPGTPIDYRVTLGEVHCP